jgi:hypothetical protein
VRVASLSFALLGWLGAAPALAQRAKLDIALTPGALQEGPAVSTASLLADRRTRDALVNGAFPTGIHYRLELWRRGGLVDDFDGRSEWDVLVSHDPTRHTYSVVRRQDNDVLENFGAFTSIEAAEAQFGQPLRVPLRPTKSGRYYYNLIVEVRTLTESDLDALQQWMRGSTGKSNPLSLIGRGIGKLLSRVLGGATQHYQHTSGDFSYP